MKPRRNLLFFFPDEFRPYSMGFLGREPVRTPNLDRFAGEATTFTRSVSGFPVCSPYRAMLFSGRYPYHNGVITNCNSHHPGVGLPEDTVTLSDCLSREGYSTGYIGKWHLQAPRPGDELFGEGPRRDGVVWDSYTPPGAGRHSFDFWYSYGCCDNHNHPHYWTGDALIDQRIEVDVWSPIHETDIAIEYLENSNRQRDPEKPFALFVAPNPPHMPFNQVPERYRERYAETRPEHLATWENLTPAGLDLIREEIADYFAMISGIDEQFGRLLQALDDSGLAEETIVIFTSDHGDMMGSHGLIRKTHWYNESLLVPFLMRHPDSARGGHRDDALFSAVDLFPSIMGLLGLKGALPGDLDGVDVSGRLLDGTSAARDECLYMAIAADTTAGSRGVRTDRYTYTVTKTHEGVAHSCIDDRVDPEQLTNIADQDPTRDRMLVQRIRELLIAAGDPFADWVGGELRNMA